MVNRKSHKKRKALMDEYKNMVYKMIRDDIPHNYIMAYVLSSFRQKSKGLC